MTRLVQKKIGFVRTLLVLFVMATITTNRALADTPAINVAVSKHGDHIGIDVDFYVEVPVQQAWQVLTDFDHMREFISGLQSSRIMQRNGTRWQVAQAGAARRGPLSFKFDSIREIALVPLERITSRQVSGSMKEFEAITRLSAEGDGTHIRYHADSVPNTFVPPIIGPAFIETETRHQFDEMRAEMLRRHASGSR